MSIPRQQCFHCGYFYQTDVAFYSEDFARYWSPKPMFLANWCFHCSKVTTYKQVKILGLFPVQFIKPHKVMTLEEFITGPWGTRNDYERGKVASQMVRLLWHCLLRHQEEADIRNQYPTFQLALEKFSPEVVAHMMYTLINYNSFADLPRQLQEGIYVDGYYDRYLVFDWLEKSKQHPKAARAKGVLETGLAMK